MNVVLYLRYSSDKQTEQSIEGQRHICEAFCAREGHQIVGEYVDRAASASHDTEKRLAFQRMIRESASRRFEAVVVYKLDRFARNRYDSATYKNKLSRNGVRVVSATEAISDSPEGIILESVLEGMAEFYSRELSQKVRRGMAETAAKGNSCGGATPLGYRIENKKYVLDPAGAAIVAEAFSRYAAGDSLVSICDDFNGRGLRTSTGAAFNRSSFRAVLRNRRYLGVYIYNGVEIPGGLPAIVDKDTFDAVQRRLGVVSGAPGRGKADAPYLLAGKAFCGRCGSALIGDSGRSGTGTVYHYYTCAGHKGKTHTCSLRPLRKDWLERTVAADALALLTPAFIEELADAAVLAAEEENRANSAVPEAEEAVREVEKRLANLFRLVERGADSDSLLARLDELEAEKKATQRRLEIAKAELVVLDRAQIVFFLSQFAGGNIEDEDFMRQLLQLLVRRVTVYEVPEPNRPNPGNNKSRTVRLDIEYNLVNEGPHSVEGIPSAGGSDFAPDGSPHSSYPNLYRVDYARRVWTIGKTHRVD